MNAWTALVEVWEQSIACVFFPVGSSNYGTHVADPDSADGRCYCNKLYGEQKVLHV
jgi:hypothetical protein